MMTTPSRRTFLRGSVAAAAGAGAVVASSQPAVASGDEIWSYFAGDTVSASPAVTDTWVYVGNDSGQVAAVNKSNGRRRWRISTGDAVSSPIVVDGRLFVGSQNGAVYAIDTDRASSSGR